MAKIEERLDRLEDRLVQLGMSAVLVLLPSNSRD
jgi:hypothetical protein